MATKHQTHSSRQVDGAEAEKFLERPGLYVLDVRTVQEFQGGAIEGATLIPVDELPRRLDELPEDKHTLILVYCAHGVRSVHAQKLLEGSGYENVHNLRGGLASFIHYLNTRRS